MKLWNNSRIIGSFVSYLKEQTHQIKNDIRVGYFVILICPINYLAKIIDLLNRSFKLSILEEENLGEIFEEPDYMDWISSCGYVVLTKSSEFLIFGVCVLLLVFASQSD